MRQPSNNGLDILMKGWQQKLRSEKPEYPLKFLEAELKEARAKMPEIANAKAGDVLSDEQKSVLRWDQQTDYLARTQLYPAPDAELDAAMQDLWLEMLQQ